MEINIIFQHQQILLPNRGSSAPFGIASKISSASGHVVWDERQRLMAAWEKSRPLETFKGGTPNIWMVFVREHAIRMDDLRLPLL